MQGRRPAGHGTDGERQPRRGVRPLRLLPLRTTTQLSPLQPLQEVPLSPIRWHRLPTHGHPTAPRVPEPNGSSARPLQRRKRHVSVVARVQYGIRQDQLLRIAQEGVGWGVPWVRLSLGTEVGSLGCFSYSAKRRYNIFMIGQNLVFWTTANNDSNRSANLISSTELEKLHFGSK